MRWLMGGLLGPLLLLQYRLWFAEGGLAEANRLASQLEEAEAENATLSDRNATLTRELMALQKRKRSGREERAREPWAHQEGRFTTSSLRSPIRHE